MKYLLISAAISAYVVALIAVLVAVPDLVSDYNFFVKAFVAFVLSTVFLAPYVMIVDKL